MDGDSAEDVSDLRELVETSQQILVRTETNRTLRSLWYTKWILAILAIIINII